MSRSSLFSCYFGRTPSQLTVNKPGVSLNSKGSDEGPPTNQGS